MKALSKKEYDELDAWSKGYACYMQAAWNKAIKDENPYEVGTQAYHQFNKGNLQAMHDLQDSEE